MCASCFDVDIIDKECILGNQAGAENCEHSAVIKKDGAARAIFFITADY